MHDFYFIIYLPKGKTFQSEKYSTMDVCIRMCEKKLREFHIKNSDCVELGYTSEYGNEWTRRPEHGEIMPQLANS